jgi:hypothetical protein
MTMLSGHGVMTLFRVVVCVPAISYILKKCGVSLLLGTPGVGCVTCLLALFSLLLQGQAKVQQLIAHGIRILEASPPLFPVRPSPLFHSIGAPILGPPPIFFRILILQIETSTYRLKQG